jgi:protein-tyrosine phosphatase
MIDLHSHILWGLDDGAQSPADSLEIARAAVADGITVIAGTPHVRDDWPTAAEQMEARVGELTDALSAARIPLAVRPGGEIAVEWITRLTVDELARFGLGGNPRYVLVETPYYGWPVALTDSLSALLAAGITPVLAHPERNAEAQDYPDRVKHLVERGVLVQVTAASIDGRIGRRAQKCGLLLVRNGWAHMLVSDAHHASIREVGLSAAAKAAGGGALARWLTYDVPAAILEDQPLPERPKSGRGTGWLRRLARL